MQSSEHRGRGYLPIDKTGADLLFQVLSQCYETGSTIVTTNQAYKDWAKVFNNDATLTSAVLDRLLHHAETVTVEGRSYRMKDQIEEPSLPSITSGTGRWSDPPAHFHCRHRPSCPIHS